MTLLLLLACTAADDSARLQVLDALARDGALAWYQSFAERSETLAQASEAACAAPEALPAGQEAWWAAREPWKMATILRFGPTVEYPLRLGPKLDTSPVDEAAVDAAVAETETPDLAAFDAKGSTTRGLPVVEYLLWSEGLDATRCAYAAGASADVARNAALLAESWEQDWLPLIAAPDDAGDDDWDTPQDALDEWVNRMAFTVENLRAESLGGPLGDGSGGEARPELASAPYSGRSAQDARDTLAGVQALWEGPEGLGIRDLLPPEDADQAADIDRLFATAAARLDELPEPLTETVLVEPELVERAQEALQVLQVALQVELAQSLGVTVTFNDNDGD
ncbi:MAG: hypothetical protein H6741_00870 [Alphaproteobacteria bacterium]|nr:hypothetical protein [Alphaproteobacteria bacterium]